MIKEDRKRKVRSDKKKDIKPTVSIHLKETICRISYITNKPIKIVAEEICLLSLMDKKIIEELSTHFRRNFKYGSTLFIGNIELTSLQREKINGQSERITIRFKQDDSENINALSYALDVTPSKATALLLEYGIKNRLLINNYIKDYIKETIDPGRMRELKKIIKFINESNPHEEEFSWSEFMSFIIDEVKTETSNITSTIKNWIDKYK